MTDYWLGVRSVCMLDASRSTDEAMSSTCQ